jgi:hypothetical protein
MRYTPDIHHVIETRNAGFLFCGGFAGSGLCPKMNHNFTFGSDRPTDDI